MPFTTFSPVFSKIPRLIRNCRLSENGELLLMPEGVLRLKGAGSVIVSLCDGKRTLRELLEALRAKYPQAGSDQIEVEALAFIDTLRDKRALDLADAADLSGPPGSGEPGE